MQIGVETSKALDQRRVFVVDPDEITRAALQFILHDEIETHEHATLEAAFEHGTGWLKPDLILLGLAVLKAQGVSSLGMIAERYPGVRILIVSDKADENDAVRAMKAGAHGVVLKPLSLESVRRKVDTVLGRRGGAPLVPFSLL